MVVSRQEAQFRLGMWTQTNRGRMADIEKKTKRYPTDLTNKEWDRITPFLPKPASKDRKP
jgi:putative transposase